VAYAADSNISVYTLQQWDTFHDLTAWSEDLDDIGGATTDMTGNAVAAIYLIGSRLAHSVVHYLDALDNQEDK
jgi:hypothetical protein